MTIPLLEIMYYSCKYVLGADAFYYKNRPEGFDKLISGGRVILEDNVDLGLLVLLIEELQEIQRLEKEQKLTIRFMLVMTTRLEKNV